MDEQMTTGLEIAVIGMAGRFPGARNIDEFWQNLKNGEETISFYSRMELEDSGIDPEILNNPRYIRAGGRLQDIEYFDAFFFGYTPKEAELMDPQIRIFHECTWAALEDAGYNPLTYKGLIGLYAGASPNTGWLIRTLTSGKETEFGIFAAQQLTQKDFLTMRISYKLNLTGPSFELSTACSTSLVAIHVACQSILNGECHMALAGGVTVSHLAKRGYMYQDGMVHSSDGHCRAFDEKADGTVGADGAGVVLLKRLEDAQADNDNIYAVIRGSAINNDGIRKAGFNASSVEGQAEAIKMALDMAEVDPVSITYVETHGTGTELGDPVEIESLRLAFNSGKKQYCAIGSVKSNIGHTNCAAGAAGFIKTVLSLKNRVIPPTLNVETPNPKINFENTPFYVNKTLTRWQNGGKPLRAGVSSFGMGGTNAHVILEEAPPPAAQKTDYRSHQLISLSAKTPAALDRLSKDFACYLEANPGLNLADAAYTLHSGRRSMEHRKILVCADLKETIGQLSEQHLRNVQENFVRDAQKNVVFMFSGLGSQYVDMGRQLYETEIAYKEAADRCFTSLKGQVDYDLKDLIYPNGDPEISRSMLQRVDVAQTALFTFEYALAKLLMDWGITPSAMIGYSFGEYTAACIAGVMSPENALTLITTRGELINKSPEGSMTSVPMNRENLIPHLKEYPSLSLAIDNGPSCILAGTPAEISAFEAGMKKEGYMCMRLPATRAIHSPLMEPILKEFQGALGQLQLKEPKMPYISNVTGKWIDAREATSPLYWVRHLKETVRFADGIHLLAAQPNTVFIEIGPGQDLCAMVTRKQEKNPGPRALNVVRHPQRPVSDVAFMLKRIGLLWLWGVEIDWSNFYARQQRRRIPLPTYPFEKHRFWIDPVKTVPRDNTAKKNAAADHLDSYPEPLAPSPSYDRPQLTSEYSAPTTTIEKTISRIWQDQLGFQQIGANDDFLELGGDSLKAIKAISRIRKELGIEIPLTEYFARLTPAALAEFIEAESVKSPAITGIPPAEEKEYYSLPPAQRRLYLLHQFDKESIGYNEIQTLSVEGEISPKKLDESFRLLIDRHEALRTSFEMVDEQPVQRIHPTGAVTFSIDHIHLAETGTAVSKLSLQEKLAETIRLYLKPFDLNRPPLIRAALIRIHDRHHILVIDKHHIIADGTSHQLFAKEFSTLYRGQDLKPLKLQYRDYSEWLSSGSGSTAMKKQEEFWLNRFDGEIPVLNLPTDHTRPTVRRFEGKGLYLHFSKEETTAFNRLARQQGTTFFIMLLAIFNIWLSKLSGQEDIVVGTPTAGRRHPDLAQIIGMFVNTLALRNYPTGDQSFKGFLAEVKEFTLNAFENEDYPFEDLVEQLPLQRDTSRNPLFDAMLVLPAQAHTSTPAQAPETPGSIATQVKQFGYERGTAKFDLTLMAWETGEQLTFLFEYSTRLFNRETIHRFSRYFKQLISSITENPDRDIADLEIIPDEEKQWLLETLNDTAAPYPNEKTIHMLVEEQAERTPDYIALVDRDGIITPAASASGERQITYKELTENSRRLAEILRMNGAQCGAIIGLLMERSLEMIISILAVLKTGAAYVPLDIDCPSERKLFILEDTAAPMLLTQNKLVNGFRCNSKILEVENLDLTTGVTEPIPPDSAAIRPSDLVYLIYTSGSTGKPKGVMIPHCGLVNYIWWSVKQYVGEPVPVESHQAVFPLYTSISFDLTVTSIFAPLVSGGKIAVYGDSRELLLERIVEEDRVTIIKLTPTHLKLLRGKSWQSRNLKTFVVGGEELETRLAEDIYSAFGGKIDIYNEYGPTETVVGCMIYRFDPGNNKRRTVPIGVPAANTGIYLLDKNRKPVPTGVPAEIHIAGHGLARGYLNNQELTAAYFADLNWTDKSDKTYKTGDLACRLPDGNLEFLGRIDHQVKIRGYRIELGEIENSLTALEGIDEAVVVEREEKNGDKYLCAYVVSTGTTGTETSQLRNALLQTLPDYMIPSYFIPLERIPLTPNGKLDRKALPEVELTPEQCNNAPRNSIEKELVEIWSDVLGRNPKHISQLRESLGIDNNFFQLGGHSLKATIILSRIHKKFNVQIPMAELFKTPTIKGLGYYISNTEREKFESIEPIEKKEFYELSSPQKRLYVLQRFESKNTAYNMPNALFLNEAININSIEETFIKLIARHESLRTSFEIFEETPVQMVHESVEFQLDYYEGEFQEVFREFVRPFNMSQAPLLRVAVLRIKSTGSRLLLIDMHHIISDGVSHELLRAEFSSLYAGGILPPLRLQYKDYSEWQHKLVESGAIGSQKEYWLNEFAGEIPILELPLDYPRPALQSFEGRDTVFKLSAKNTDALNVLVQKEGVTLFMVLLAVYNIFLSKLSSQEDIVVGIPIAGRRHSDLERIIGMFVNTLPIRNKPKADKTFRQFLEELKEKTLEVFENQDYPFENIVQEVSVERNVNRNPLFDVMFSFLNFTDVQRPDSNPEDEMAESKIKPYTYNQQTSKFDLTLTAYEKERKLNFTFEYCTKLFKEETILRFVNYFERIISAVMGNPDQHISEIGLLSPEEKRQILIDFNDNKADYSKNKNVHQLFEEQVEKTPAATALISGGEEMTYRELNENANRLAHFLKDQGGGSRTVVGIMMERSSRVLTSIIAILKVGGAYVPIDATLPESRIRYMVEISSATMVLMLSNSITFDDQTVIEMTELITAGTLLDYPSVNLESLSEPEDLTYIIFTSGSTGVPKGAGVYRRNFSNLMHWFVTDFGFNENDRNLLITSLSFDLTQKNLYAALITGGTLVITGSDYFEPARITAEIQEYGITWINCTPSMFYKLVEERTIGGWPELNLLRYVFLGGEPIAMQSLLPWLESENCSVQVVNTYGPTECTDICTAYRITDPHRFLTETIPLGSPVYNVQVYIVDKQLQPVPIGVAGELVIGGDGVGIGYLNRPELTVEKFINLAFDRERLLLYRTGDLARWLPDGNIEFLGRIDLQVKIRGFRIELGEIETRLLKCPEIDDAVVIDRENSDGKKFLCAYLVTGKEPEVPGIKKTLSSSLPDYMIPSYFIRVEKIPLSSNGKVDRRALEAISIEMRSGANYAAPQNEIEQKIARIWEEVLQLEKIGIHENFFDVGGNSLDIIKIDALFKEAFDETDTVVKMFRYSTIHSFAEYLHQKNQGPEAAEQNANRSPAVDQIINRQLLQKQRRKRR